MKVLQGQGLEDNKQNSSKQEVWVIWANMITEQLSLSPIVITFTVQLATANMF